MDICIAPLAEGYSEANTILTKKYKQVA